MSHDTILQFIDLIRGPDNTGIPGLSLDDSSRPIITEIFTTGNCGNFAKALQLAFGGEIFQATNRDHAVCKINGRVYDITGDVTALYPDLIPLEPTEDNCWLNNYSFELRGPII